MPFLAFLLNPRVLIALAIVGLLAFTHIYVYRKGSAHVKAEWTVSVANANAEARQLERARQRFADEAGRMAATREARLRADAARAADSARGLRAHVSTLPSCGDPGTAPAIAAIAVRDVLGECSEEVGRLAAAADAHASDVKLLLDAWPR